MIAPLGGDATYAAPALNRPHHEDRADLNVIDPLRSNRIRVGLLRRI
jgi:hypothetical protein